MLKVRLYRPFSVEHFLAALPKTVKHDRRAGPHQGTGRRGRAAVPGRRSPRWPKPSPQGTLPFAAMPRVIGGRYGLSSKEFTPAMVKAVFDELTQGRAEEPLHGRHQRRRHPHAASTTTRTSRPKTDEDRPLRCSTASAPTARSARTRTRSRSSAKRPTTTPRATSSTTRRSPARSRSRTCASARSRSARTYLITQANFIACHQFSFLEQLDMLKWAEPGAHLPAQHARSGRTRSGTTCRARCRSRSSRRS